VRALERLDSVDPDHLRGWLFTVAYHQAMLTRRQQKARLPSVAEHNGTVTDLAQHLGCKPLRMTMPAGCANCSNSCP